ncbi:hypothetical protein V6N11_053193 [Hibiscus sabdariffa]|uniref:Uncharacterized protein n=1 Tax=Hibiscus sabdariffa TaxID=183260 RepID=A0ABR2UCY7_9ROSI
MCEYLLWFVIDLCSECLCGGNPLYATSGLTGTMAVSIVDEQRNWDEMLITVDSTTQRRSRDDLESKFLDFPSSMGREDNPGHWTLECLKFDNSYFKP